MATAKELLDSLVDHLQSQADLLPDLHAQLGLPHSALAADLERIRAVLAEAVEAQVQQRHSEVNEWMERCEKIERDCSTLAKCLGSSVKSSPSVLELRKVTVLPKRHEQLVAHQDKLWKTYTAKIEQRNSVTNRLLTLSRILGPGFYSSELLVPIPTGATISDDIPRRDVTPEKLSKLEKEIERGRVEITERLKELSANLEQIVWFYSELGIELPVLETIEDLSVVIADEQRFSSGEASSSTSTSRSNSKENPYDNILARYVSRLTEGDDEAFETGGVEGVEPTLDVMEYFESLKFELDGVKNERELNIQAMYDDLETLWKRLGVDDAEIDAFVELNRGTTEETVAAYEEELRRMNELKQQGMTDFVHSARDEISSLWDELMMGQDDRSQFTAMFNDDHNEDLLTRHEEEILRLKEERRSKGPLLVMIRRYFDILDEERQLAESVNDSSRLTGRAPRGDPGRLLREEKMRKRVKKDKPRLEQELLQSIPEWEETHGIAFRINDERIFEKLQQRVEVDAAQKEKPRSRTGAPSSRATTPAAAGSSMPSSGQKHPAPGSAQGPPNKRARLTPSTSSTVPPSQSQQRGLTPTAPSYSRQRSTTPTGNNPGRAPLRVSAYNNANADGPPQVPTSASGKISLIPNATSSAIPRPASSQNRHYGFGTGIGLGNAPIANKPRAPSGSSAFGGSRFTSGGSSVRSVSATGSILSTTTTASERSVAAAAIVARKTRRESFKPRSSLDSAISFSEPGVRTVSGAWNGDTLKEESEDDDVF